jgi:hypothetical protein
MQHPLPLLLQVAVLLLLLAASAAAFIGHRCLAPMTMRQQKSKAPRQARDTAARSRH